MKRCMGCMRMIEDANEDCPYCGYIQNSLPEDERYLRPGCVIMGRYLIGKALGSGGFGITYIAWDSMTEKTVAIKEYFPSDFVSRDTDRITVKLTDPKMQEQFVSGRRKAIDESRTLAALGEIENVTDVYDCFEENNTAYIVMEYLDGITLKDLLKKKGKLSYQQSLRIIFPVINSLEKVHTHNLIHRDISPDNIFLCKDGKVKILDFGSARYSMNQQEKTYTIVLKHGYAPVEQYSARSIQGPWTDVYAVAATFYKMITGKKPLNSFERVNNDTLLSPKELGVSLPDYVDEAIMHALCVDSKYRTRDMAEFKRGLTGVQERQNKFKEELHKDRALKDYSPPENEKSQVGLAVAIIALIVSIAVIAVIFFLNRNDDKVSDDYESDSTSVSEIYDATEKTVATTQETTTEEPTTEEPTTAAPDPIIRIQQNGQDVDSITVAYTETAMLVLENIPSDSGDIRVDVDSGEDMLHVNVTGNLLNDFIPISEFPITFTGKKKGETSIRIYLEKYPEVSITVPVYIILPDDTSDDIQEDNFEE